MKPFLITLITIGATILHAEDRAGVTSSPGTNIVSKLEQIVSLRQQAAQRHAALVSANRVPYDSAFEIALAKAQLDLARERRADEECLKALSQLVTLRRKDLAIENLSCRRIAGRVKWRSPKHQWRCSERRSIWRERFRNRRPESDDHHDSMGCRK